MTILIGAIHDGKAYIGADTLWTWSENFVREHTTSKFVTVPVEGENEVLIATSGQDKFTQILDRVLRDKPELINFKNRSGILKLLDAFQREVKAAGIGDAENNQLPDHDLGFMIISSASNKIWVIESDYGVLGFEDYVCAGSGAYLGEAAMKALGKLDVFGGRAVKTALETVCELHPYCGGTIETKEIELKLSEPTDI
jgi:ATP-dependent protease HslVU (ClpYQ) peptidase subunit